jgi:alkanesulfonate monooxygenase SsuD/methylene tetrahydromethanopterin reductase-like flavin-dependent oxidoreductase (luciferase family)
MGPIYPRLLQGFGTTAAVDALLDAADARRTDLPAAAEDLAREVTLFGTYDQAGEAIAAWSAAGADSIHLVLPPGRPEQELREIIDVAAAVTAPQPVPA